MILVVSGKKITDPLLIDVYTTVYEGIIERRKIYLHLKQHHGKNTASTE